jgi:hypothetical protein
MALVGKRQVWYALSLLWQLLGRVHLSLVGLEYHVASELSAPSRIFGSTGTGILLQSPLE